jgi:membrane-associated phospholipid phosphatase
VSTREKLSSGRAVGIAVFGAAMLLGITVLVQSRVIEAIDRRLLELVVATRPVELAGLMNWVFRLGFAQVDVGIAIVWSLCLWLTRRSVADALPPLLIALVIGVQVGLRILIDQPQPDQQYTLARQSAANSIERALDRSDESVRTGFQSTTSPASPARRGSFPSGHASRTMFLALWAGWSLRERRLHALTAESQLARMIRRPQSRQSRALYLIALVVCALFPLAVSYSAMFFGYHWLSDIFAGFLVAATVFPVAVWISRVARGFELSPRINVST